MFLISASGERIFVSPFSYGAPGGTSVPRARIRVFFQNNRGILLYQLISVRSFKVKNIIGYFSREKVLFAGVGKICARGILKRPVPACVKVRCGNCIYARLKLGFFHAHGSSLG